MVTSSMVTSFMVTRPALQTLWILIGLTLLPLPHAVRAEPLNGDAMLARYFEHETKKLQGTSLAEVETLEDWLRQRGRYRQQLQEMLGLDPWPERTPLQPTITGQTERDGVVVERVHFQSRPGLYVTGNLYRPAAVSEPLPAILYVCGHGRVEIDGVSYGNKVHYQHHGAWFARNGYVCLTIDSVQLGEIESIHHGTYRYDMWWWLCRGYTPAGVEAWNCIRAIDYLQARPEVDPNRLGVTGRSGGGIYSWWLAALDDRIQAAVPVAGITDLTNHVVDGCVEGHCDCMYFVNTFRWDYPHVAALVAPRPLLISNTDRDSIFPLDGVVRTYVEVRRIYQLHDAPTKLALNITAGPHKDTQELRVHAFRWFNEHLKGTFELIRDAADARFEPSELKVFASLPEDERNTSVHEWFVPKAKHPSAADSEEQWSRQRDAWFDALRNRVFAGWPAEPAPPNAVKTFDQTVEGLRLEVFEFTTQPSVRLPLYLLTPESSGRESLELKVVNESEWSEFRSRYAPHFPDAFDIPDADLPDGDPQAEIGELAELTGPIGFFAPRGIGPTAWSQDARKRIQYRRRFYLLGQTLDGMRIWDIRRALQLLPQLNRGHADALHVKATGRMSANVLYASLFEPNVGHLHLVSPPSTHRDGPFLLNVMRFLDLPQAIALAAEQCRVEIHRAESSDWEFALQTARQLSWPEDRLRVVAD